MNYCILQLDIWSCSESGVTGQLTMLSKHHYTSVQSVYSIWSVNGHHRGGDSLCPCLNGTIWCCRHHYVPDASCLSCSSSAPAAYSEVIVSNTLAETHRVPGALEKWVNYSEACQFSHVFGILPLGHQEMSLIDHRFFPTYFFVLPHPAPDPFVRPTSGLNGHRLY